MTGSQARQVARTRAKQMGRRGEATSAVRQIDPLSPDTVPLLDDRELMELAGGNGLARLNAGTPLLTEGEAVESLYLIRSGEVEVYRRAHGRRLVVEILHPGDLLGLAAHLLGRRACTAPEPSPPSRSSGSGPRR